MSTDYYAHQAGELADLGPQTPPRVKFGPRDDDDMPHSWAQRGLTWLHENRPAVFADMMLAVLDIDRKKR